MIVNTDTGGLRSLNGARRSESSDIIYIDTAGFHKIVGFDNVGFRSIIGIDISGLRIIAVVTEAGD